MSELHEEASEEPGELFSSDMKAQLRSVFEKMQQNVI